MDQHYEVLGLQPGATAAEIKAAYHSKLKEFPAHTHPQEFKAIRAAYETLRKQGNQPYKDLFTVQPLQAEINPQILDKLHERAAKAVKVEFEDVLRLTF